MRPAEPQDAPELADLEREVFGDNAWSEDSLLHLIADDALVLAEPSDGEILAYAAFRSVVDEAELLRLAVRPESRRRGLGRTLLLRGLNVLLERGVTICHLEVRSDNAPALRLYGDLGFELVGRRPSYYADGCDAELWHQNLAGIEKA